MAKIPKPRLNDVVVMYGSDLMARVIGFEGEERIRVKEYDFDKGEVIRNIYEIEYTCLDYRPKNGTKSEALGFIGASERQFPNSKYTL